MPWGGGNGGSWGSLPWGDGANAPPIPPIIPDGGISEISVLSSTLLKLTFSTEMKVDGFLTDPGNYSIVPVGDGQSTRVTRVLYPSGAFTSYVLLQVDAFTVGENYDITISASLRTRKGKNVDPALGTSRFYGRVTKLDFAQQSQQKMFTRDPGAIITSILVAITGEDEKIGGSEGSENE